MLVLSFGPNEVAPRLEVMPVGVVAEALLAMADCPLADGLAGDEEGDTRIKPCGAI